MSEHTPNDVALADCQQGLHSHPWTRSDDPTAALACAACGVLWPGDALPRPAQPYEGWGELADQPSWASRVDAVVAGLGTVA